MLKAAGRAGRRHAAELRDIGRHRLTRRPLSPVRFVIFGRGRSGSTALVSLLDALPDVHCEGEILNKPMPWPRSYVHARCAASETSVYGCKVLSYQIEDVQPLRRRTEFVRQLSADGFRIIHLKRENLVEHAVSNLRAREFGFHRSVSAPDAGDGSEIAAPAAIRGPAAAEKAHIEPAALLQWIAKSEALDRFEATCLVDVAHLALTYEHDLAFEKQHQPTVTRVAEFLGLSTVGMDQPRSAFHKVSPRTLADSVANYSELTEVLAGTPYARFLG